MRLRGKTVLPFTPEGEATEPPRVGRVRRDGSIAFRGETCPTIRDLPPDCLALVPDLETWKEWKRLYRAIDPDPGRRRAKPRWLR